MVSAINQREKFRVISIRNLHFKIRTTRYFCMQDIYAGDLIALNADSAKKRTQKSRHNYEK